jgi:uncharacterized protein YfbU (UPF0304 family)
MKLTEAQRLILANQYLILEQLAGDDDEKVDFSRRRQIVNYGFELEYDALSFGVFAHGISEALCKEVVDILEMHISLSEEYEKTGNLGRLVEFRSPCFGVDDEAVQAEYARFRVQRSPEYYAKFKSCTFYSAKPMLRQYRSMLAVWRNEKLAGCILGQEAISRILAAGIDP